MSWSERGNYVAVGTHRGYVQVWDVAASKRVNCLEGHSARVGALAWNGDMLSSGSRDRMILQRDVRTPAVAPERKLVCSLSCCLWALNVLLDECRTCRSAIAKRFAA